MFIVDMLVAPALTGLFVFGKDILYDRYLPESPHVIIDVVTNVVAKLVSSLVVVEFIVPRTNPMVTWIEPLLHGSLNGLVKSQFIDTDAVSAVGMISSGLDARGERRMLPQLHHYSFENGFLEGAGFNLAGKLAVLPIDMMMG